jgi:hypothetical protein
MSFYSDIYQSNNAPALALSQFFNGKTPESATALNTLSGFIAGQEAYGHQVKVADSDLFGYETLGKTLGETAAGQAKLSGGSDAEFVARVYGEIYGRAPTEEQTTHFLDQLAYFQGLYESDPTTSQTTLDFGARGAIAGQMMGGSIAEGTSAYAKGVFNVFAEAAQSGTGEITYGKPLSDYHAAPVTPPPGGGSGGTVTPPPADVIVKAFNAELMSSSTKGDGSIQAGTGIPNENFQTTTNQTKGIELGLQVVQRGGPTIYTATVENGVAHFEAPAGSDPNNAARAGLGITFSVNTGINDALTGPHSTKLHVDLDPTSAVSFEVFDVYKDSNVTSANVAQDVFNYAFLSTPQPSPLPGEYTIMLETTDSLGHVLASQTIVVDMVAPVPPLPLI